MFPQKALPPFVSVKKAANLQKVNLTSDHFQVQPLMFTPILARFLHRFYGRLIAIIYGNSATHTAKNKGENTLLR